MDLDGDGFLDVISGSWPGTLHLFAGLEGGGFAAGRTLVHEDGSDVNVGRAAAVYAHDWDGDGRLDLLVGDIEGRVWLVRGRSGEKGLAFGPAEDLGVRVRGGDAGPTVADWDLDGRADLVVGAGDGSVMLYRDTATEGIPVLAEAEELVPTSTASTKEADPPAPGRRTKVQVVDWNGDGLPDLLLGDFCFRTGEAPDLTEEQQAAKAEAQKGLSDAMGRLFRHREALRAKLAEEMEGQEPEAIQARLAEHLETDEAYRAVIEEMAAHSAVTDRMSAPRHAHGWVWVYLRESQAPAAPDDEGAQDAVEEASSPEAEGG